MEERMSEAGLNAVGAIYPRTAWDVRAGMPELVFLRASVCVCVCVWLCSYASACMSAHSWAPSPSHWAWAVGAIFSRSWSRPFRDPVPRAPAPPPFRASLPLALTFCSKVNRCRELAILAG